MSHPLSHSDLLRIIEEYLASDLTKYASEKDELQTLRRENRELKAQLKREELGHKAYKLLFVRGSSALHCAPLRTAWL